MALNEWKKGDNAFNTDHHNEAIKWINKQPDFGTGDNTYRELDKGGAIVRQWIGKVVTAGPDDGETPDDARDDNTYWVVKQKATNDPYTGSIGNGTHQKLTNDDETSYEDVNEYTVLATNLSESITGSHSLREGQLVKLFGVETKTDSNGRDHTIYYINESPKICFGVLSSDWIDGENFVTVDPCKSATDATFVNNGYATALPTVTVYLFSDRATSPKGVFLKAGDIIAFKYIENSTTGIALPIDKGVKVEGCYYDYDSESYIYGSWSMDNLVLGNEFIVQPDTSSQSIGTISLHLMGVDPYVSVETSSDCGGTNIGWNGFQLRHQYCSSGTPIDVDDGIIQDLKLATDCNSSTCPDATLNVEWEGSTLGATANIKGKVPSPIPSTAGLDHSKKYMLMLSWVDDVCVFEWVEASDCESI